jgi:hypothetical protein
MLCGHKSGILEKPAIKTYLIIHDRHPRLR